MEEYKIERPKILTNRWLIYWAEKEGVLIGDQKTKAIKFIENNCVKKIEEGWDILPIKDYNKTTHKIRNGGCSCQWAKKGNGICSHIRAVELFIFKEKWNEKL